MIETRVSDTQPYHGEYLAHAPGAERVGVALSRIPAQRQERAGGQGSAARVEDEAAAEDASAAPSARAVVKAPLFPLWNAAVSSSGPMGG